MCPQDSAAIHAPNPSPVTPLPTPSLVAHLLRRGDRMEVACGRLMITPSSGQPVPGNWLNRHFEQLTSEIGHQLGARLYIFESYSTGRFNKGRLHGVQLQFTCALTGESRFVIFNAEIERQRETKHGRPGSILPNNQFKAGKKSAFAKFWRNARLPEPQRKGWYSNLMGKLKGLIFTGAVLKGEKLNKQTLQALNLAHGDLLERFGLTKQNRSQANPEPYPNNPQTVFSNTRLPETHMQRCVQLDGTAGAPNRGNTVTRECGNHGESTSPYEQTLKQWLAEYNHDDRTAAKLNTKRSESKESTF